MTSVWNGIKVHYYMLCNSSGQKLNALSYALSRAIFRKDLFCIYYLLSYALSINQLIIEPPTTTITTTTIIVAIIIIISVRGSKVWLCLHLL